MSLSLSLLLLALQATTTTAGFLDHSRTAIKRSCHRKTNEIIELRAGTIQVLGTTDFEDELSLSLSLSLKLFQYGCSDPALVLHRVWSRRTKHASELKCCDTRRQSLLHTYCLAWPRTATAPTLHNGTTCNHNF